MSTISPIAHLTASRSFGGPERQMLGLAHSLTPTTNTVFASFSEGGLNHAFLEQIRDAGFEGISLQKDTPNLLASRKEIHQLITDYGIQVLVCHGYKAVIVGWFAAQKSGIPVIAVSRGWTAESWKVRVYERLDRMMLRKMDRVVCVSRAQALRVSNAGVSQDRIKVIHNSIDVKRFEKIDSSYRNKLIELFPDQIRSSISFIVGSAGRLSPEKGFDVLVNSAAQIADNHKEVGFVLFGDGHLAEPLQQQIAERGLESRFILAGFTNSLDKFVPHFDIFVQSSHTEGLPNVLLESLAAGTPVVATDVGGTREVLDDGRLGILAKSGSAAELGSAIENALANPDQLHEIANQGKAWIEKRFSFANQAEAYSDLLRSLVDSTVV